jgi:hypothetical protein
MSGSDKKKLTISCPKCGARGAADVSTNHGFHVDKFPADFSLLKDGGGLQYKTVVRHSCGAVFDL